LEKIRQDPWIGTGYNIDAPSVERLALTMASKSEAQIMQMALGSQWHNRWLGCAADFGIPAAILALLTYLFVIYRSWWSVPRLPRGSLRQTMVIYILISAVTDVVFSNLGGHSATDAFLRWWMYGVSVAIACSIREQREFSTETRHAHIPPSGEFVGAHVQSMAGSARD
jgi:O-antigen ligase